MIHTTTTYFKHAKVRKNSKYIQIHATLEGKRYRFSTKIPVSPASLAYVEKHYLQYVQEYKEQQEKEKAFCTMIDIAQYGMKVLKNHGNKCKKSTIKRYEHLFVKYIEPRIGDVLLTTITKVSYAQKLYEKFKDLSRINQKIILGILRLIFDKALLEDLITFNPFATIKNEAKKEVSLRVQRSFSMAEMKTILSNCQCDILSLYLHIAFFTGMRTNEILALRVDDIDLERGYINVSKSICEGELSATKTYKRRDVEIIEPLALFLYKALENKTGLLFSENGNFLSSCKIAYQFKKLLKKLNITQNTLYATRHTFATLMLSSGEDLLWVSSQLGHEDSSVTLKHYVKYIKQERKRGINLIQDYENLKEVS